MFYKNLKRKMAIVMATVMFVQVPVSSAYSAVYADDVKDYKLVPDNTVDEDKASYMWEDDGQDEQAAVVSSGNADRPMLMSLRRVGGEGTLKIEVTGVAPSKASSWDVELTSADDESTLDDNDGLKLAASEAGANSRAQLVIDKIPVGEYTLRMTPDEADETAYLPYEQDITIGNNLTTIKLINGDPGDYGYKDGGSSNYGILSMGDINDDGSIGDEDLAALTEAVAQGVSMGTSEISDDLADNDPMYGRCDLNGDGKVDLLDVAAFAKYYDNSFIEENHEAKPVTSVLISKEDVTVAKENNTETDKDSASVQEIFSGTAEKPLKVESKDKISAEKPAVIATEFNQPKEMNGLVIDPVAGSADSIVDGEIIVTDGDGDEYEFTVKDGVATLKEKKSKPGKAGYSQVNNAPYASKGAIIGTETATMDETAASDEPGTINEPTKEDSVDSTSHSGTIETIIDDVAADGADKASASGTKESASEVTETINEVPAAEASSATADTIETIIETAAADGEGSTSHNEEVKTDDGMPKAEDEASAAPSETMETIIETVAAGDLDAEEDSIDEVADRESTAADGLGAAEAIDEPETVSEELEPASETVAVTSETPAAASTGLTDSLLPASDKGTASDSTKAGVIATVGSAFHSFLYSLSPVITAYADEPTAVQEQSVDTSAQSAKPIVIDLGGQVAVKKITIKVTKTLAKDPKLVDISKVEFFDDMADRIPEPELSVPERLTAIPGDKSFTLSWKNMPNVSSYEVFISGLTDKRVQKTDTITVETNSAEVTRFAEGDLLNGSTYTVVVRSINGSWKSEGATVKVTPDTNVLPPAPEDIVLEPGYRQMQVSWKDMKDTKDYTLHYREVSEYGSSANAKSIKVGAVYTYTITGLEDDTEYEIWLTGHNKNGEGPQSIHYKARTSTLNPPVTPNYKLINNTVRGKELTNHIKSVSLTYGRDTYGHNSDGSTGNGNVVADGNFGTSWILDDWDAGYYYGNKMPLVTFDAKYTMNSIVLIPDANQKFTYSAGRIFYRDNSGKEQEAPCYMTRYESNGKYYYMLTSYEPFTTDQVRLATYTYGSNRRISVAEMKFYHYDTIEDEIMGLYDDLYHITLKAGVDEHKINDLRSRLAIADKDSHEYHPRKKELEAELDNAAEILADNNKKSEILIVDNKDTQAADKYITFKGGLNTYQPLGVTALADDVLTVYVGGPTIRNGNATRLELVAAQYHGSSAAVFVSLGTLKAGSNTVQVKAVDKMTEFERGGQLYIHYTGNPGAEQYGVRVLGGRKSAVLDISDVKDHAEKVKKAEAYIAEAKDQLAHASSYHDSDHGLNSGAKNTYSHDPKNCVYHATDIVSKYAMFSTSVDQVLEGLKDATHNGTDKALAEQLVNTMDAMDQMLVLYYHNKGLSDAKDAGEKNAMPVSRINIRYQRMFYGAFMYAGGKHIGIEWPELKGLMGAKPITSDKNGKYTGTGSYFGWGIAHEIGHEINEGAYVTAEVTNNFFALLSQAEQSGSFNNDVRFKYEDIFKKVTSGTMGKASNVFTQLAMYWQLHLAYDLGGYNYKIYDTYKEQYDNLFWARVDSIVRDPSKAPGAKNNALDLETDKDNRLMRLAVAAAKKDILEIFRRYGYEPNEGTIKYASQFDKETRGIWFANDETRAKQIEAGGSSANVNKAASASVSGKIEYTKGTNKVKINLESNKDIWMYEIYRSERVKGEVIKRPVGYAEADESGKAEFTDVIGTINNRAFTYEAIGYDMWLNPTKEKEIGEVKVSHNGLIDKSLWTVDSNMTNDKLEKPSVDNPDASEQPGLDDMVDDNLGTAFKGSVKESDEDNDASITPEIIINFNNQETVTGVRYKTDGNISFKVYISMDAAEWTPVEMKTKETAEDGTLVYFDDGKKLYTYDAAYMKLIAEDGNAPITDGREITVYEISVLGQTGDDVDIASTDGIGILSAQYVKDSSTIPQGSLIFTGTYKGNPAYNAVMLWDEEGNVVGGTDAEGNIHAEQIIFAPQPEGKLTEVSDGKWVYYIPPQYVDSVKKKLAGHKVRAELYRVDNAHTNEGERLVSSTVFVTVPRSIPSVTIR